MESKYIYHKDKKNLRCRVSYEKSSNTILLQLQEQRNYLLFNLWEDKKRELQMIFTNDDVERLNKLYPYLSLCRDIKYYQSREDVLISAINELFEKYIESKNKKNKDQKEVKQFYENL